MCLDIDRFINASEVIKLYMLCYPDDDTSLQLTAHGSLNGAELVKVNEIWER